MPEASQESRERRFQLSVVIPHLNEGDNLRRCLAALERQRADGVSLEIIVVDNGSDQLPEAACAGIRDLHLVVETTPGPGPARNLGARIARSDIVAFVDADCVVQSGWASAAISESSWTMSRGRHPSRRMRASSVIERVSTSTSMIIPPPATWRSGRP